MRTPGPLRAFGGRVAARRGPQVAVVAVARKLATLALHLLTSGEDYAYPNPGQVRLKWRRVELLAGEPSQKGRRAGVSLEAERGRGIAVVADRQARGAAKRGAGAALGRAPEKVHAGPASAADA